MMHFDHFGLAFDYPDNWRVETDDSERRYAAVTVYSPEGAFWGVSGHESGGIPAMLAKAVVDQMRDEYRDLDCEPAEETIGDHTLAGFDLNFYCLDLTNTAQIRTLATPEAIYLFLCQADDREWEKVAPVFKAITTSFVKTLAT
jgi:hypothetical protein